MRHWSLLRDAFEAEAFTCKVACLVRAQDRLLSNLHRRLLVLLYCLKRGFPQYALLTDTHSAGLLPCHPILAWLDSAGANIGRASAGEVVVFLDKLRIDPVCVR